jgi:hypothetical protein
MKKAVLVEDLVGWFRKPDWNENEENIKNYISELPTFNAITKEDIEWLKNKTIKKLEDLTDSYSITCKSGYIIALNDMLSLIENQGGEELPDTSKSAGGEIINTPRTSSPEFIIELCEKALTETIKEILSWGYAGAQEIDCAFLLQHKNLFEDKIKKLLVGGKVDTPSVKAELSPKTTTPCEHEILITDKGEHICCKCGDKLKELWRGKVDAPSVLSESPKTATPLPKLPKLPKKLHSLDAHHSFDCRGATERINKLITWAKEVESVLALRKAEANERSE